MSHEVAPEIVPEVAPEIVGDTIVNIYKLEQPRLNKNLLSSQLFILPSIYGYYISYIPIMLGSIICLLTSSANHYYKSEHKIFRMIDILSVNTIAIYFGLKCLSQHGYTFYFKIMLLFALLSLFMWFFIKFNPQLYKDYYWITHAFAVTGVMICIKAYDEKLCKSSGNIT